MIRDALVLMGLLVVASVAVAQDKPAAPAETPKPAAGGEVKAEAPSVPIHFKSPVKELNLGFSLRHRYEVWRNYDFNTDAGDTDDVVHQQARLNVEVVAVEGIKGFLQVQDARAWGNAGSSALAGVPVPAAGTGNNTLASQGGATDLHQAYVTAPIPDTPLSLQLGRQEWSYANQKVIGAVGWSTVGRAFDGLRARCDLPAAQIDLLASRISEGGVTAGAVDEHDVDFYGIYSAVKAVEGHPFDLYWLILRDDRTFANESTADAGTTLFHTAGVQYSKTRPFGPGDLEYGTELDHQFGRRNGGDHSASAWHGRLGYGSKEWPWQAKFLYQYDRATGDNDPTDGDSATFQQLFPTGHIYHGYMDLLARQNIRDHWISLQMVPAEGWKAGVHWHRFAADAGQDSAYRANGVAYRTPAAGASGGRDLGQEVDLTVDWKVNGNWSLQGGAAHFFPGRYFDRVRAAGAAAAKADGAEFFYVQSTIVF